MAKWTSHLHLGFQLQLEFRGLSCFHMIFLNVAQTLQQPAHCHQIVHSRKVSLCRRGTFRIEFHRLLEKRRENFQSLVWCASRRYFLHKRWKAPLWKILTRQHSEAKAGSFKLFLILKEGREPQPEAHRALIITLPFPLSSLRFSGIKPTYSYMEVEKSKQEFEVTPATYKDGWL